jgi:hypothetical protein
MSRSFAVAYDYRCPFARNACEHVLDGLEGGADWDVRWVPFSLSQSKEPNWDRETDSGLLALELSVAIREEQPQLFTTAHRALFAVRHDHGLSVRDPEVLREHLAKAGVDVAAAEAAVKSGEPGLAVRADHEWAATEHTVWGVPTFIAAGQAVFVRLMERSADAPVGAPDSIDRIVDMLEGWPGLNEFKHTSIAR